LEKKRINSSIDICSILILGIAYGAVFKNILIMIISIYVLIVVAIVYIVYKCYQFVIIGMDIVNKTTKFTSI